MKWVHATLIDSYMASEKVRGMRFEVSPWTSHIPGQYYAIKLVDRPDSFVEKYYSVSNANTESGVVEFGIQLIDGGEVSPTLHTLNRGDSIYIKGPLGSHFSWTDYANTNVTFIAGGSGIVPFMSFLRTQREGTGVAKILLLGSFKDMKNTPYFEELLSTDSQFESYITLTKEQDEKWLGPRGRITRDTILTYKKMLNKSEGGVFVCGSTQFVEAMVKLLKEAHIQAKIRVEMFG